MLFLSNALKKTFKQTGRPITGSTRPPRSAPRATSSNQRENSQSAFFAASSGPIQRRVTIQAYLPFDCLSHTKENGFYGRVASASVSRIKEKSTSDTQELLEIVRQRAASKRAFGVGVSGTIPCKKQ